MQLQNGYSAIFDKIHRSEVRAITHSFHTVIKHYPGDTVLQLPDADVAAKLHTYF